jgi:long-chain acyl-CoA synthetase
MSRPYALAGLGTPAKPAIVMGSGESVSYADLEQRINRRTRALRALGLAAGDRVAYVIENSPEFLATAFAVLRTGLVAVPMSTLLTAREIAFIVEDSGASLVIASPKIGRSFDDLPGALGAIPILCIGPSQGGLASWTDLAAAQPTSPLNDETAGSEMLYSSGTTGRPKGIVYKGMAGHKPGSLSEAAVGVVTKFGLGQETVFLSPAPLYHSAPHVWSIAVLRLGGTVVVMEKYDAERALQLIAEHQVTAGQFVPTHFVRMLKLPRAMREAYDVSSLRLAVHAAAPCPIEIKREMINWFGPVVFEYFGSSEQNVLTTIDSYEALNHPGSVGRCAYGKIHICDETGKEVPVGTIGTVYSEGAMSFRYHNDPEKTAAAHHPSGWSTVGDIGYLDRDGYLYLADRGAFVIITGGVNVYPQEIENILVSHPRIADAAVVGVPDLEMGEIVTALVQLLEPSQATEDVARELRAWLREQLSGAKVPKRIVFTEDLPRLPTGKMKKHLILERLITQA